MSHRPLQRKKRVNPPVTVMREGERPREAQESIAAKVRNTLETIEEKVERSAHAPPMKKRKRIWSVCCKQGIVQLELGLKPLAPLSLQFLYDPTPLHATHWLASSSSPTVLRWSLYDRPPFAPPPCALYFNTWLAITVGAGMELRN